LAALVFSAGGDGGRGAPEVLAAALRFAVWLVAYVIVGLLLAVFRAVARELVSQLSRLRLPPFLIALT
jgi:hypothetical protein